MKKEAACPILSSGRMKALARGARLFLGLVLALVDFGPVQAGLFDKVLPAGLPLPKLPPEYPIKKIGVPEPPPRDVVRIQFGPTYELLNTRATAWFAEPQGLRILAMSPNMLPVDTRNTLPLEAAGTRPEPLGMEKEVAGGHYVSREISTLFMRYLKDKFGILTLPTVITRLTDDPKLCATPISVDGKLPYCASTNELERLMLLMKSLFGGAPNVKLDAYLSVEQFGLEWNKVEVIVEREDATEDSAVGTSVYNVRPRRFAAEKSICQEKIELDVPSYKFYADLLRLPDGAFIARFTERRAPTAGSLTVEKWVPWKPVTTRKLLPELNVNGGSAKAEVIIGYIAQSDDEFVCNGLQEHYGEIRRRILNDSVKELSSILTGILDVSFDGLGSESLADPVHPQ